MTTTVHIVCAEPRCTRGQWIDRRHVDNLAGRWRCHEHDDRPSR